MYLLDLLHDDECHLNQYVEHVVMEASVRLVELIDEQERGQLRDKGLPDHTHADVLIDAAQMLGGGGAGTLGINPGQSRC